MKFIPIIALCILTGCAINQTPPLTNQIQAASLAAQEAALQIDRLQKSKLISNELEDELMDKLLEINEKLRLASSFAVGCAPDCSTAEAKLRSANTLLIELQTQVPKTEMPK